jgi:hypothetical protein
MRAVPFHVLVAERLPNAGIKIRAVVYSHHGAYR